MASTSTIVPKSSIHQCGPIGDLDLHKLLHHNDIIVYLKQVVDVSIPSTAPLGDAWAELAHAIYKVNLTLCHWTYSQS